MKSMRPNPSILACLVLGFAGGGMLATPAAAAAEPAADAAPARKAAAPKAGTIVKRPFGKADGKDVSLYTLTNRNGVVLKVSTFGAIITELHLPDRQGKMADVVLGFDKLDPYLKNNPHFGSTIGRIANRIKGAAFTLDGATYRLAANNGPDHLHGGVNGWDKKVWDATTSEPPNGLAVKLTCVSADGDEGYPGAVKASVTYTLTNNNELRIEMQAATDKTTIVNMAHHTYWNLGGHDAGPIVDHELMINASQYTPGAPLIPDGSVKPVAGGPLDFHTAAKPIGRDLAAVGNKPAGYDHNFVVDGEPGALRIVARAKDPKSGRVMIIEADQPGVQFYTSNYLDGSEKGKGGVAYQQHAGFCLETQKFPNAINIPAWRDQVILQPGKIYTHRMVHKFSTE